MFAKGTIHVSSSKESVVNQLRRQRGTGLPFGKITDNSFKIFKAITRNNWKIFSFYVICGNLIEENSGTTISYSIRPSISAIISTGMVFFALMYGLWLKASNEVDIAFVSFLVILNALWHSSMIWQMQVCRNHFESGIKQV